TKYVTRPEIIEVVQLRPKMILGRREIMETIRYVTRPEIIEAVQLTQLNFEEVAEWCGGKVGKILNRPFRGSVIVPNVDGNQTANCWTRRKRREGGFPEKDHQEDYNFYGDYIIKQGNRFTVVPMDRFDAIKLFDGTNDYFVSEDINVRVRSGYTTNYEYRVES